jgi:tRNA dimethylallyltransferase
MNKILVVVGPTASGKSDLAVYLAEKFNGEIISADSRQVYKGLDVGTGKITKKEMRDIPHYLLDVANVKKQFTASDFKKLADKKISEILKKDKLPIVAGGTGFYIDALRGVSNIPEVPINKLLRKELDKKSVEELFEILNKKDPRRAQEIDSKNKVRLSRALEIIEVLGYVPETKTTPSPYQFIFIGINPEMRELEEKIYKRLLKRLPGMIKEAKKLHKEGLSFKRMYELGLEYRYLAYYLEKKLGREEMVEKLYIEIRKYAKRQMTWFKRNKEIKWFEPGQEKEVEAYIRHKLTN